MKKTIIILLSLLLITAAAVSGQGWEVVPFPLNDIVTGFCAVDADTFLVTTATGRLGRTMDAGKTWDIFLVKDSLHLEDLYFLNSDVGFVVGRQGALLKTTDGGYTWKDLNPVDTQVWLSEIDMFDEKTGLAIGMSRDSGDTYGGVCLRTTDGGKSWTALKRFGLGYGGLVCANSKTAYILSFGRFNRSDDAGKTWRGIDIAMDKPARTVSIIGEAGIIGGLGGACAYTTVGGQAWTEVPQKEDAILLASQMIDDKIGYLAGANSLMLVTSDGGRAWGQELLAKSFNVLAMELVGDRLYAVGSEGSIIYKVVK